MNLLNREGARYFDDESSRLSSSSIRSLQPSRLKLCP
jgi:hypothetical protein